MADPNSNGSEKRNLRRWHLFLYLRVFDQHTGELLGNIVDISENGLMLISDKPLAVDREFHMWVDMPTEEGDRMRIQFKATSRWCGKDVNPDFYDTGFQIIDPDLETVYRVQQLIDEFRFYR
ncbi:MAG: PilZ domain-containing protein [Gammaproteobacteria bacterium]|nr:PilZ domain-containing protein [Gammaproteobacteria bacterium]MCP5424787.1 PilZ domain-containing protein [Gammaproteobacteria bacterium]MCP5458236.1 PilZ domain-containing protein [Gammaproteobacteria bacterium]